MKRCPRCGQTYTDAALNFCLEDGELLSFLSPDAPTIQSSRMSGHADDEPATEFLNRPRPTSETNWPQSGPVQPYQSPQRAAYAPFAQYPLSVSPNQTLAIISLILGASAMTIGWCCSTGLLLSPAALITGFIALAQIKKNPQMYGGRGFAIGGIVVGGVFLLCYLLFIIIYGIALIAPNL